MDARLGRCAQSEGVLDRPAQIRVNDQGGVAALRADESEVREGGRFPLARAATGEGDGVGFGPAAIELMLVRRMR